MIAAHYGYSAATETLIAEGAEMDVADGVIFLYSIS